MALRGSSPSSMLRTIQVSGATTFETSSRICGSSSQATPDAIVATTVCALCAARAASAGASASRARRAEPADPDRRRRVRWAASCLSDLDCLQELREVAAQLRAFSACIARAQKSRAREPCGRRVRDRYVATLTRRISAATPALVPAAERIRAWNTRSRRSRIPQRALPAGTRDVQPVRAPQRSANAHRRARNPPAVSGGKGAPRHEARPAGR